MHHFDEMAKALAGGLTRRQALRRVAGGLAGVLLGSLGVGRVWGQAAGTCPDYCRGLGLTPGDGNAFGKCVSNCARCKGHPCGADACCTGDQSCAVFGTHGVCGRCGMIDCHDLKFCGGSCSSSGDICACGTTADGEDVCVFTEGTCVRCSSDADCPESGQVCVATNCSCAQTGGRVCAFPCAIW
jgi:hypothetical protein